MEDKAYICDQSGAEFEGNKDWLDFAHGKKIQTFHENGDGMIGNYFIAFEWMDEVDEN